ncbi:hypothetical protein DYBT9623_00661 [Dyadobacter sp. CECT 9623]|uniref:Uncharacterized protein n=1 Tax=Dyadobacter linearis TaxID=2823330 RepID=A0ABN7R1Z7_9BACT|nr:hypothetical protein [Dyadobacter sp. CECT 9623]CAG5067933.1 hypothetical protein DYBT9623_00661 [Dyadobacter sp. CECT 9623]
MGLHISLTFKNELVFTKSTTHNNRHKAQEVGLYELLWYGNEHGFSKASQLIEPLSQGIETLLTEPDKFQSMDSPNGWGLYEYFLPYLQDLLRACKEYPDAEFTSER